MIDKRALDAVRFAAKMHGADAAVEAVVAKMLPSIRLVPQERTKELPLGGCRIGGCPDLPAGMSWPRRADAAGEDPLHWDDLNFPLQFILQVNLAEVAPFDAEKVLPKKGLLSFFFFWDEYTDPGDEEAFILRSDVTDLRRVEAPDDLPAEQRYQPLELKPVLEWTVPTLADAGVLSPEARFEYGAFNLLQFADGAVMLAAEAQGFIHPSHADAVVHRLLGHPQLIQSPGLADGTRLLLQVDSDTSRSGRGKAPQTGMTWGDSGRLYYLISDDELRSHRLTQRPWVMVQMC